MKYSYLNNNDEYELQQNHRYYFKFFNSSNLKI